MTQQTQTALITGATGAIGRAIAQGLAQAPGWQVVLVGRDEARTRRAAEEIGAAAQATVHYELADLSRKAEIEALAGRWQGPLQALINNAAITPPQREETPEGIEKQWATNVLAYFWLSEAMRPILAASAPARIINVASYYAGGLDLNDPEYKQRRYDNNSAYRQSKQANRMLTVAQAERFKEDGITVNSCHPGDVNSKLSNNLGFGGSQSPQQGADTPLWLALDPTGGRETGRYFANRRREQCRFSEDRKAVEALYQLCQTY